MSNQYNPLEPDGKARIPGVPGLYIWVCRTYIPFPRLAGGTMPFMRRYTTI